MLACKSQFMTADCFKNIHVEQISNLPSEGAKLICLHQFKLNTCTTRELILTADLLNLKELHLCMNVRRSTDERLQHL